MAEVTRDTLFGGRVLLAQPARARGYRVNVDAVLLAAFAARRLDGSSGPRRRARSAFDLGAGVGAVGLTLLHLDAAAHVTLVEIDRALAHLARQNVADNAWTARGAVVDGDAAEVAGERRGGADLVVCNPPYVPPGRGRTPSPSRAAARSGRLETFLDAARELLGRRGRAAFVYPAIETTTLFGALRARGLEPKRARFVHGTPTSAARVVLVEAVPGRAGGLVIEPPLVETDGSGRPTPEISSLLGR